LTFTSDVHINAFRRDRRYPQTPEDRRRLLIQDKSSIHSFPWSDWSDFQYG